MTETRSGLNFLSGIEFRPAGRRNLLFGGGMSVPKNKILAAATIACFAGIVTLPLGLALMWFFLGWKKKTKIILTSVLGALYAVLLAVLILLEPSVKNGGFEIPFIPGSGTAAESSGVPGGRSSGNGKNSSSVLPPDSVADTSSLPVPGKSGGKSSAINLRLIIMIAFVAAMIFLIIRRNTKPSPGDTNPYVDTSLYKLPLEDGAQMPPVHYQKLVKKSGEEFLFATEASLKNNPGDLIISNRRVVFFGRNESFEFPLSVLEAVSSISDTVMRLTSGSRKYFIFMNASQMKYALAVLRWAYRKFVQE